MQQFTVRDRVILVPGGPISAKILPLRGVCRDSDQLNYCTCFREQFGNLMLKKKVIRGRKCGGPFGLARNNIPAPSRHQAPSAETPQ